MGSFCLNCCYGEKDRCGSDIYTGVSMKMLFKCIFFDKIFEFRISVCQ